ncbi:transposase, IS481 family [Bordetella pertussis STO1-CHOC-0019]|nr:transposase, IS481 family [Bordetella pertussis STO1-CHOC-0019]
MNTHKHARLTFLRRLEMVQQLIAHQVCVPEAARAYGVTAPTVRKWLGRFLAQGQAGLADASSRPTVSPRAIAPAKALAIVELRRKRLTQARIAQALGVSASTVSRVLARAGLSHPPEPAEPVCATAGGYEHQAPGDLLHIDIKKLGRIQRPGHRVTGNRRDTVEGAGWDFVFVAIDDQMRPRADGLAPSDCAGQGAGYRGAAPQAADPSAHRQPGRSASPSAASWPAPAVAQPGATSIRPPAICCTSTSRSWDVSSALARSRAHTVEGPAGTSSSWPSMTTPAWPSPTSTPTSASPAPSSSSRTQWPTTSAWA